jgi:uncharacterized protein with PIN domain
MNSARAAKCEGKVRYPNRFAAEKSLGLRRRKRKRVTVIYRCPFCRGWHKGGQYLKRPKRRRMIEALRLADADCP